MILPISPKISLKGEAEMVGLWVKLLRVVVKLNHNTKDPTHLNQRAIHKAQTN